jgi:hypothetical protein
VGFVHPSGVAQVTTLPSSSEPSRRERRPGGTRRFVVAMVVVLILLGGVVTAIALWMKATQPEEIGPAKLKFPENRYYRQKPS